LDIVDLMTTHRRDGWLRRVSFSSVSKLPLGYAEELWDPDWTNYEGWERLQDRLQELDRDPDGPALGSLLNRSLLVDVIAAAGGMEHSIENLRTAVAGVRNWLESNNIAAAESAIWIGNPSAVDAWYSLANLLSWARHLDERLDRQAMRPKRFRRQGLLPAIQPEVLRLRVGELVAGLRNGPLGAVRNLANFEFHVSLIQSPWSGVVLTADQEITMPIPDATNEPVLNWYLLKWSGAQDGLALAEQMWSSVESFMDALLAAFEDATPDRLRK
jgi:hypothetical protein